MRIILGALVILLAASAAGVPARAQAPQTDAPDSIKTLVDRLDLEKYKATIKGLTQFGDRRQGTDRNRQAVDWIEAQLKGYGCPTGRIAYVYDPPPPRSTYIVSVAMLKRMAILGRECNAKEVQ